MPCCPSLTEKTMRWVPVLTPGLLHLCLITSKFLRILNYNSCKRVILELSSYCNLLENTSLVPSQKNKLHSSNYEERKTEQNKTTLCLCANLPRACGLDAVCASDSTSPKKIWENHQGSGRDGEGGKDVTVCMRNCAGWGCSRSKDCHNRLKSWLAGGSDWRAASLCLSHQKEGVAENKYYQIKRIGAKLKSKFLLPHTTEL